MAGHSMLDRYATRGQLSSSPPHTKTTRTAAALKPQGFDGPQQRLIQTRHVVADRPTVPSERHERIDGQLPRRVRNASTSPAYPVDADLSTRQLVSGRSDVNSRSAATNRNGGPVFAEQNDYVPVCPASHFIDESLLEFEEPAKIDRSQKVEFGDCV